MKERLVHHYSPEFAEFVAAELKGLSARAQEAKICLNCLSDRLLVEVVAKLVSAGTPAADILNMVAEGMDQAEEEDGEKGRRSHRIY